MIPKHPVHCTPKPAETEQLKQREDDHGHRVTARHKAFNAHLCFPFENRSQSLKEIEQFMDRGGNGRRVPAWNTEFAAHLHFPVKNGNVPQCENHIRDGDGVCQPLEEDIEHFMDDPKRGACSLGEESSYSDSNRLLQAQKYKDIQDEEDNERIVTEKMYLDDIDISVFSEEEISKNN